MNKLGNYNSQFFENKTEWLNSKEAADYLRISVPNLRLKIYRGIIPEPKRLGRTLRFRRDELDRLLETSNDRRIQ